MNHLELLAMRQLFLLSVDEAAYYIAEDGNNEQWEMWERGEREIPLPIVEKFESMKKERKQRISAIIEKINNRIGNNTMRSFSSFNEFLAVYTDGDFLEWKVYQSVANELYSRDLERLC
ncbi:MULTISPECIES: DUF1870 family protein [Dickeya]|uniref:DUF1870 family protein n=1 Tax=Dickeya zeae (strain Ech586) TaxID=590409 RepID=D2BT39_DICZ5|nr:MULTISPECIES: DUF1870 family protein [Dickeya]ACZ75676.1 Domain of unknown function DUF1870 [Dickeya parazeae Ech586]MBP2834591.1 YdiL family protein [Dickeya parazeae]UCZ76458.1 YdiL family protein [Dickeya zeae]